MTPHQEIEEPRTGVAMATLMHSAAGREKMEVGESEAVHIERWEKL